MTRNVLFLALGAVIVVCVIGGYQFYQQRQTSGIDITVSRNGLSVLSK